MPGNEIVIHHRDGDGNGEIEFSDAEGEVIETNVHEVRFNDDEVEPIEARPQVGADNPPVIDPYDLSPPPLPDLGPTIGPSTPQAMDAATQEAVARSEHEHQYHPPHQDDLPEGESDTESATGSGTRFFGNVPEEVP